MRWVFNHPKDEPIPNCAFPIVVGEPQGVPHGHDAETLKRHGFVGLYRIDDDQPTARPNPKGL